MAEEKQLSVAQKALQCTTIQEFLDHSKDLTGNAFGFPRTFADFDYYSPKQIGIMARNATDIYRKAGLPARDPSTPSVVGLRAASTIDWVVSFLTLNRLGHTVLVISPTLAIDAVGALMSKTKCDFLLDGTEHLLELKKSGKSVIPLAKVNELRLLDYISEPSHNDLSKTWACISEDESAVIVHSSGTTGLPKLIHKSHRELLERLRTIPPICHDKSFVIGAWLYYMSGLYSMLFSFVKVGGPTCWANERLPVTPEAYRDVLMETKPQMAWFNPRNLMAAASTDQGLEVLKKCMMVTTTGGVLPEHLGNRLVKAGVRISNEYGMTELSLGLSSAFRPLGDPDWEYVQPDPASAPYIEFQPLSNDDHSTWTGGEQLFELVILPTHPTQDKQWANSDDGSFRTGDLFIKHPTSNRYKCTGRMCDYIRICPEHDLVGLNAALYENKVKICNDDMIEEAVLFGNERRKPGFLIFTKPGAETPTDQVVDRIWTTVEREINGVLPVPLERDLLLVIRDAVVPRTPKGNFIRPQVYLNFEKLIDAAYES